ncbi:hypothetical protein BWI15_02300 [Kribbella sp. ALI-6-A]|uniref:hypothetical protein n=1 Tax=Kribbella sp. ALI-6-A TaxID=1933817 RepID=UPI00097C6859|nr:hypothetical protein [Kribbella sp. ALI-6-A]ONI78327.1 hypothetical protein BWI15_02300 [Kribbella sp. ALI-6-A]
MELDNIFYSGERGGGGWVNREPTPEQVTVRITYENDSGDGFTDEFPLDTNLIRNRIYTESFGAPEAQIKMIAKSAKTLADLAAGADRRRRAREAAQQRREATELTDGDDIALPVGDPERTRAFVDRFLRRKRTD